MTFGGQRERSLFCQLSVLIHQASDEFRDIQSFVLSQHNMTLLASMERTEVQGLLMGVSLLKWKSTEARSTWYICLPQHSYFVGALLENSLKKKGRISPSNMEPMGKLSWSAWGRQLKAEVAAAVPSSLAKLEVTFRKWQRKEANTTVCVPEIKDTLKTSNISLKDWTNFL